MGVPILTPPLVGNQPAIADEVMALFDKIVAEMNGQIDRDNLQNGEVIGSKLADGAVTNAKVDAHAAIDFTKLGALTDGQMVFGHTISGVGTPEAKTVSGAVTADNTGKLSGNTSFVVATPTGLSIGGAFTPVSGLVLPGIVPGGYLLIATVNIAGSGDSNSMTIRAITTGPVTVGSATMNLGTGGIDEWTGTIARSIIVGSTTTITIEATTGSLTGVPSATAGTLFLWRVV